jgi:hypothetical protein
MAEALVPLAVKPVAAKARASALVAIPPPLDKTAVFRFVLFVVALKEVSFPAAAGFPNCHPMICADEFEFTMARIKKTRQYLIVNNFLIEF